MNASEYKRLKQQRAIVNFSTLETTRKLLEREGELALAQSIATIVASRGINKSSLHNQQNKRADLYYLMLSGEGIKTILLMLFDLEAASFDKHWQATHSTSLYAFLVDTWNNLLEQRSGRDASTSSA